MCIPLLPLALMAAGTFAKYLGEKKAERAREQTFNAERDRQKAMTDEQQARFQDSLGRTQDLLDPAMQQAAQQKRESSLASVIVPANANGSYMPGSSSAPAIVAGAADKVNAEGAASSSQLARALAALGATGDQMQGLNIGIGRDAQQIGQIGGFKAGSAGVLDAEMQAAAQKGAFLRGIGGLAQTIGTAWMGAPSGSGAIAGASGQMGTTAGRIGSMFKGAI